jgi:hypothetical protein
MLQWDLNMPSSPWLVCPFKALSGPRGLEVVEGLADPVLGIHKDHPAGLLVLFPFIHLHRSHLLNPSEKETFPYEDRA